MAVVYQHRRNDTGDVFYIGIGSKKDRAKSRYGRNLYWKNIVNKVGYTIEILHTNISRSEAEKIETELIQKFGRKDLGLGNLVNLTDGGEKPSNISELTKNILRKKLKGNKNSLGTKHTDETKRLLSENRLGHKHHNWGKPSKKKGIPLSDDVKIKNRLSQPNRKKITVIDYKTNQLIASYEGINEMINDYFGISKDKTGFNSIKNKVSEIINNRPHRILNGVSHYRKSYKGVRFELISE